MRILVNARIYTLDPQQPIASALAIDDHAPHEGRVLGVGDNQEMRAEFGHRAQVEDLEGRVVLPGLIDAHLHLRYYAHSLEKVDCATPSKAVCIQRIAQRAAVTPPGLWIQGHGWNQNEWPDVEAGKFGTAADLDAVAPHHPVYLTASSLHAAWANTAALRAAGISASTPDPPNGAIQRDEHNKPTGMLFENAMRLVAESIPQPSQEEITQAIKAAQKHLWRMGLTGVHDFDRIRSFRALQTLHHRGELGLRVVKNLPVEALEHILEVGLRSGFGDHLLRIGAIKVFMDGALGPHTAAMFQPYEGEAENRGMLFMDGEQLFEHAQQAAQGGLGMTVHAIGDRANHEALAAFEQLREFERATGLPALRQRIEHVQVLHPDDLARLAELGVVASMQPIHATADMLAADQYWGARARYAYAWRTLSQHGTRLAFGSDAPVESPNPFWGLHAAVTRQRADGAPGPQGWYPVQRLSVEAALQAYTTGAAFAAGVEDHQGMLAPGYLADLIVLGADPFNCPPEQIRNITPLATMVGGDWVWQG